MLTLCQPAMPFAFGIEQLEPLKRGVVASIQGRVFRLVADRLAEALRVLDEVEGAVAGDYRRVRVDTHGGHDAWAYAYGGGLRLDPIADGSWVAHLARLAGA